MNSILFVAQATAQDAAPAATSTDAPAATPAAAPTATPSTAADAAAPAAQQVQNAVQEQAADQQQSITQADGTTPPPAPKPEAPSLFSGPWVPLLLGIVVLYFFVFRSKRNEDRKRKDMLAQLKRGDRVQTIGGILGSVVEANETSVLLKVDESSNAKIRFSRSAVHRVMTEEKTDAK